MAGMKKTFVFEFEDGSAKATGNRWDGMSMSYADGDHTLHVSSEVDGIPTISGNSSGLISLGRLLIQMGMSEYQDGYHVHVYQDFHAEVLIVSVHNSNCGLG
jgi:hypothetical protein